MDCHEDYYVYTIVNPGAELKNGMRNGLSHNGMRNGLSWVLLWIRLLTMGLNSHGTPYIWPVRKIYGLSLWILWESWQCFNSFPMWEVAQILNHSFSNSNEDRYVVKLPFSEFCKISLVSVLTQIVVWCHQASSHYLNQCCSSSVMP